MPTHGQEVESEMEELLLRIVPGLADQWKGSTPHEIDQIQEFAGRPLPPFYRWFLSRMGQSMGPLAYPRVDFSAQRVIAAYTDKQISPPPGFLFIGHDCDEMMSLHFFYDLNLPARADARVTRQHALGGERHEQFETFRELLAYGALLNFRFGGMPQRCRVMLSDKDANLFPRLDPIMEGLGFRRPIPTGAFCGFYESHDAIMICSRTPREKPQPFMVSRLGGSDAGTLRKILGALATDASLKVEVKEWTPLLT
jgi:hypothetical protein